MSKYEVKYRVNDEKSLSTLIAAVSTTSGIDFISALPIAEDTSHKKHVRYVNGKKNKGISGKDLVLQMLATGQKADDQIAREFARRGFAASSASSVVSLLKAEKKIESVGNGLFKLKK